MMAVVVAAGAAVLEIDLAGSTPPFRHVADQAPLGQVAAQAGTLVRGIALSAMPAGTTTSAQPVPAKTHTGAASAAPPAQHAAPPASAMAYLNPLRSVFGLLPQRIDMGVDFAGTGPVYAIGDAVITNATSGNAGWPGGGWITYQLTDGPAAGLMVYLAEDVTPTVQVGQHVTASTQIATMFAGGAGIETGWAMPDGSSAESQLAVAGGISGGGPFPTAVGVNFDQLLIALGVPAAPNLGAAYGVLPSNYPTSWSSLAS